MEALKIEIKPIEKALALFDVKEAVFADIESFKALQIIDTKTETDVRKARMSVRDLRYKIQNNQKEINSDLNQKKKDVKEYAELLISRIEPVENDLDGKIKAVEQIREEKRLEKERIEKARIDQIDLNCGYLERVCINGLSYNLTSDKIFECLTVLNEYPVTKQTFQERYEWAEGRILKGIEDTNAAYQARLKYETDQEEQAKTRAAQVAEAKKLADDRAKFEAEQAAARAESDRKAAEEAEKIRLANEKLEADREAIRKQEAEIEARKKEQEVQERKERERILVVNEHFVTPPIMIENCESAEALHEYYEVLKDLDIDQELFKERASEFKEFLGKNIISIRDMLVPFAIEENKVFDCARKEKLRADAERANLISADIEKLNQAYDHVFKCWSKMVPVKNFDTLEGEVAFNQFKTGIGDLLSSFQTVIAEIA